MHANILLCNPPAFHPHLRSFSLSLSLYSLFSLSRYFLHVTGCVWMLLNEMQEQRLSTWATERLLAGQSWRIQYSAAIYCAGLLMFGEDVGPTTVRWEGAEERAEEIPERKRYYHRYTSRTRWRYCTPEENRGREREDVQISTVEHAS